MQTVLTFDVGTTSMKCVAFNEDFKPVASSSAEYTLHTEGAHIVEADPAVYFDGMCRAIRELFRQGVLPSSILSVGVTTQGETTVVLDRSGEPIGPAIVWLDDRAEKEANYLSEQIPSRVFYETTGLPEISGALPLSKLRYLLSDPDIRRNAHKILLLEDYLVFRLTGVFATEQSLICSTGYYNIIRHAYETDFLDLAGARQELLPEVRRSGTVAGYVTKEAAASTGLLQGTPVVLTAMDQTASAIGSGNIKPGIVSETTGTCLTVAATVDTPDFSSSVPVTYYTHYDGRYLALAYNTTAAIIMKWFKDEFIQNTYEFKASAQNVYDYMSALASSVPPGSEGLFLLPHFQGKAMPDFRPNARGVFAGISLNTTKSHFIRAIMEGISYLLRENLESFEKANITPSELRSLGGGARDALWLQIKADVTGKPIMVAAYEESTSLGAAILSFLAVGSGEDIDSLVKRAVAFRTRILPEKDRMALYDSLYRRYRNLDLVMSSLDGTASPLRLQ